MTPSMERAMQRVAPPASLGPYAVGNLVATSGTGVTLALGVLFFTQVVDLSSGIVAAALTVGASVGLAAMPLVGVVAGRWGPRPVYLALLLLQSVALLSWQVAEATPLAVAVLTSSLVAERGINAVVGGFVGELPMTERDRAAGRAYLRALTNVGLAVGGGVAALALALGGHGALRAVLVLAALAPLVAAVFVARTPVRARAADLQQRRRRGRPWRDRRFCALALTNGVLAIHLDLLAVGLPLLIVANPGLPSWSTGVALALAAVAVVVAQVPTTDAVQRDRTARWVPLAGAALVVSVLLLAAAQHVAGVAAVLVVLAFVVANTLAELTQSSVEFIVSYEAAPDSAHSEYQAAYAFGRGLVRAAAPVTLAAAASVGPIGWIVLAAVVGAATAAHRRLVEGVGSGA